VFAFGSIVLTRFPFTDLSGDKRRPALVVSADNDRRSDLIVCFITSVQRTGPDLAPLHATPGTGLKVLSAVRFDKLATIDRSIIAGKIGDAPADWLAQHRATFFGVFGFGQP
jgi:mRNA interferase MazF